MAKAPSFLEFYKALTSNAQAASKARSVGAPISTVRLNYGTYGTEGGGRGMSPASKKSGSPFSKAWLLGAGPGIISDMVKGEEESAGMRLMDILSRSLYASANYSDAQNRQAGPDRGIEEAMQANDIRQILNPEALKAAGRGLTGESKMTYRDVLANEGEESNGFMDGLRNFGMDVALDPLSYVGPGLFRAVGSAARRAAPKVADEAVEATRPVLEGNIVDELPAPKIPQQIEGGPRGFAVDSEGTANRGLDEFLKYLDSREGRSAEGIPGDVFQAGAKAPEPGMAPPLNLGNLGDDTRLFQAGPEGVRSEVLGLPGPTPDVIASRIRREQLDELAQKVSQFEYGNKANVLPDEGWWKVETKKIPLADPNAPRFTPDELKVLRTKFNKQELQILGVSDETAMRHIEELEKVNNKYRYLSEQGDKDLQGIKDPLARIVMQKIDEPVYPAYEPKEMPFAEGKGGAKTHTVWVPRPEDVRDGNYTYMGEIRERLQKYPPGDPRRDAAKEQLLNHLRAVRDYAKSNPPGYQGTRLNPEKGYQNYIRDLYGVNPKHMEEAIRGTRKPESVLPVSGPFDDAPAPKYEEIKEFVKLGYDEKKAYLTHLQEEYGIKPEHITYLAQASNRASFESRLYKIQHSAKFSRDIEDVADAIADGRIQALDEEGLAPVLEFFKVKTLKQLETAIRKELKTATKAQRAMLGKLVPDMEGVVNAPGYKNLKNVKQAGIREVGPTGAEYKPYSGKAQAGPPKAARLKQQVEAAKVRAKTVPRTEEIIEQVKQGDKTNIVEPNPNLTTSQEGMYARAINSAVVKNVIEAKTSAYPYTTRTGVKRTHKTPGKGYGRRTDVWNAYSQYDVFRSVIGDFSKQFAKARQSGQFEGTGLRAKDINGLRAEIAYKQVMPVLDHVGKFMRGHGVFPTLGVKNSDTPVGMFDVFDSIGPGWVKEYIFKVTPRTVKTKNGERKIYESVVSPTQLMGAMDIGIAAVMHGKIDPSDTDEIARLMLDHLKEVKKGVPNNVAAVTKTQQDEIDFMDPLVAALDDLVRKAEKYAAERKLYHDNQISKGTQTALDEIARQVVAPDSTFAKLMAISNELDSTLIPKVSRTHALDPDDAWMVNTEVNSVADQFGMTPELRAEAKRAALRNAKVTVAEKTEVGVQAAKESRQVVDDAIPLANVETKFEGSLIHQMINAIFPHFGNERIRPMYLNHKSPAQTTSRIYHGVLGDISQKHGKDLIQTAWNDLQVGKWSQDEAVLAAQTDLKKAIDVMFADDAKYSMFSRRGLTADELNAHFDHFKIHPKFRFKDDASAHAAWRQWDTNDPLDLLSKAFAASTATLGKKLLGDDLMAQFGSKTKRPGYVKLARTNNEILRYIDVDNYYFPRDIAQEMNVLDKFLKRTMDTKTQGPFLKYYDEALHRYKSGLTIYRPGHHTRNMVGDLWLSHMAGVDNPLVYKKALDVMMQYRGRYQDFDVLKALSRGDEAPVTPKRGDPTKPLVKVRIGGKTQNLTAGEIQRAAYDNGLLTDYRTLEDIQFGDESETLLEGLDLGPVGNRIKRPFGGKVHDFAATVSESRDHYVRLAHFIDTLEKGNFKSLDEAFSKGAITVRKWHPDGSDLSHFEQKGMRRVFLFYSWIRKAMPLVMEGMVTRPGRAMVYPKFIYDMAEANGIDLESLSNPFPTDQLFPEWIREGLSGPVTEDEDGKYFGINPGVPMLDVLGDYGGFSPLKTVLGSTSPAIKLPWEVGTGPDGAVAEDARTGIPYFDVSDYVDKQIPNASLFVNSTGRSLTQPWQAKGGEERTPEETADPGRSLANFLTGLGITPMSKEAYIKQAKREESARK